MGNGLFGTDSIATSKSRHVHITIRITDFSDLLGWKWNAALESTLRTRVVAFMGRSARAAWGIHPQTVRFVAGVSVICATSSKYNLWSCPTPLWCLPVLVL